MKVSVFSTCTFFDLIGFIYVDRMRSSESVMGLPSTDIV